MRIGSGKWPNHNVDKDRTDIYRIYKLPEDGGAYMGCVHHSGPYEFTPMPMNKAHLPRRTLGQAVDIVIRLYEAKNIPSLDTKEDTDMPGVSQYILHCNTCMTHLKQFSNEGPVMENDDGNYEWDLSGFTCECEGGDAQVSEWIVYDCITKTDILTNRRTELHEHGPLYAHIPVTIVIPIKHNSAVCISKARDQLAVLLNSAISHASIRHYQICSHAQGIVVKETAQVYGDIVD